MHAPRSGLQDPLGYMSGSMVVFRGALFPARYILEFQNQIGKRRFTQEQIQKGEMQRWDETIGAERPLTAADANVADYVYLPGMTSTSESFKVAMDFAKLPAGQAADATDLHSVLFVICLHNYRGFKGFRMNSSMFSAHPEEREILLREGAHMAVMGVEDMYIDNSESGDVFWRDFDKKTITVIYLFHTIF